MNFYQRTWTVTFIIVHVTSVLMVFCSNPGTISCDDNNYYKYRCQDGSCISRPNFCDGHADCPDGTDELNDTSVVKGMECKYRKFPQDDYVCTLPDEYFCDHELDCMGGRDECGCNHTFQCDNGDCVLKVSFCDNLPTKYGCLDGSDEKEYNRSSRKGFQCPVTRTHQTKVCALPDRYVCDGDSDCDFGIDECFCNFTEGRKEGEPLNNVYFNENCFRCLDHSLVIPNIHVCDGLIHCNDLSDECACPEKKGYQRPQVCESLCEGNDCGCPGQLECVSRVDKITEGSSQTFERQDKICVDQHSVCDRSTDCENMFDEAFCPFEDESFRCQDGSKTIPRHQICNGPRDCADSSDELHCHDIYNYFCKEYRKFFPFVQDWGNDTETRLKANIPYGSVITFDRPFFTDKCDGISMCTHLDDECGQGCPNEPKYCEYVHRTFRCPNSGSLLIGVEICDGKPTCNDTHPEASLDEYGCPGRFYCHNMGSTRLPIHIPDDGECNGKPECDDLSDEMNCSEKTHFYCEDGGSTLFVPVNQVCDGRADCKEGADECQNCNPSPFSSDERLISSRVLIWFLWIIGLFAVVGNGSTVVYQIANLARSGTGPPSQIAMSNKILVLNLSLADLLVGIYLIALGVKDASVDEYCVLDQEWRSSTTCSALGTIALIGTETSVFILCIMTAYRLYLVIRPFKSQKLHVIIRSIVIGWAVSLTLALAPSAKSAQDYFVSCVWFRSHQLIGKICWKDLQKHVKDLKLLDTRNEVFGGIASQEYSWDSVTEAMKQLNSSYVPERYFGYYSAHSVCLPRLFPDPQNDEAWKYSLFLILINFFAFLFILISYVVIYRITTNRNVQKTKAEETANLMQRKIARIVLTDFCCWMPICIMAFLKLAGVHIPDMIYAITAIILLPINSAMNPFLYSDALDDAWVKLKSLASCVKPIERAVKMVDMTTQITQRRHFDSKKSFDSTHAGQSPAKISNSSPESRHTFIAQLSIERTTSPLSTRLSRNEPGSSDDKIKTIRDDIRV